ncbi:hypothetical protein BABINDRAFT_7538 [Babjeviella inositovora NRRL Y-12698]|uniref:Holocytochrome c-type synthase n=1 Tax=Babjeviella inositovora NRRL Y-12698 TaxID=984486 RepID=A0A1E3QT17_9ASCO|nr:uncharacterized protein BABINDRAFT_7538 [Babjeviella inositovora NRRL Y-12698]ODQ80856.1 hypothetical protein BABINDRAFT_7538 [Babjeviella inositovora NRRL Y-12698]
MSDDSQPKCPVDHSAREVWSQKAEALHLVATDTAEKCPVDHTARADWMKNMNQPQVVTTTLEAIEVATNSKACSSDNQGAHQALPNTNNLPIEREISTIPRTGYSSNWIYPSQKQFFDAMARKDWSPNAADMKTVVPIHNQVNERAWAQIMSWEKSQGGEKCGGVQLTSFKGDSKKLTPRARWNCFWGYEKPFDRHDWTINRCGTEVEYVIDFYGGKANPQNALVPSFYLDVRPKLNSVEGFKMRLKKVLGI